MEWRKTLQSTKEMIQEMYDFILQYKLICDVHTVDFFSENHWDHIIPEEWKVELVSINDDALCFLNPEKLPHCKFRVLEHCAKYNILYLIKNKYGLSRRTRK